MSSKLETGNLFALVEHAKQIGIFPVGDIEMGYLFNSFYQRSRATVPVWVSIC